MKKPYYITTPIYYVNDRPHIGHAYTTVIADTYARFHREQLGAENVFFLTGTDEHGTKIAQSAVKAGLEPQAYVDSVVAEYKKVWAALGISHDAFFRTTDPRHEKIVQDFLTKLYDAGHIYKKNYKGWYCVGCEKFLSFEEIVNGACIHHPNTPLVEQEEENYFFKLSEFTPQVLAALEKGAAVGAANGAGGYDIFPVERRNEIAGKMKQEGERAITDVSVSRPNVAWGIPLPWDPKHTVYVWVDALINYLSATKMFPAKAVDGSEISREHFWPADLHLVGKDILWFHTLIWQGLLLASGLELPRAVVAHGFFTIDGQKMSKSLGNVIDPMALVAEYGAEATRYLLITAFPFGSDGDISLARFKEKYNADLANGIGNLVARVAKLAEQLPENPLSAAEITTATGAAAHFPEVAAHFADHRPDLALSTVIDRTRALDQKIGLEQPWKKEGSELAAVLAGYAKELIAIGTNLRPFLPETAEKILTTFTASKIVKPAEGLFGRK